MSVCYIIAAGDCGKINIDKNADDIIIAADGGVDYCIRDNIVPDIIIGDFDSAKAVPENDNVIRLPVEKDDTDTFYAVKYAMGRGFCRFVIYGGTGGKRPDHTFANIALLAFIADNSCEGFMYYNDYTVTAIKNSRLSFSENAIGDISVFSYNEKAYGVIESGLKYSLCDAELTNTVPLGVSNSFTGSKSFIEVKDGILLIYFEGNFSLCTIDKLN